MVPAKRTEEASAVPTDKSSVPVEIRFVGDDSVGMVNHFDDLTCHMDRLPNEIPTIIIDQVLISSNFSWPNHRCHVYNQLYSFSRYNPKACFEGSAAYLFL